MQGQEELTLPGMALEGRLDLRTILRDRIPGLGANGVRWKQASLRSWEEISEGPSSKE